MKNNFFILLVFILLHINSMELKAQDRLSWYDCNYVWKQGTLGHAMGENSMFSGDIDGDGLIEIICSSTDFWNSSTFWYILEYDPVWETYLQKWISPYYISNRGAITVIDVFNLDNDGALEIAVGFDNGTIEIYDGYTNVVEQTLQLPESAQGQKINRILFADADNDQTPELICCTYTTTFIYTMPGLTLESIFDYGGADMRCGNVDQNLYNELVYSDGDVICVLPGSSEPVPVWKFYWPTFQSLGFLRLCDIDSDGIQEIIHARENSLKVYDADLEEVKFIQNFEEALDALLVADTDNDGYKEILVAENHEGDIWAFTTTGTQKWRIPSLGFGVSELNMNDLDNDGQPELMWSPGSSLSDEDYIYVYSLPSLTQEWKSTRHDPPYVAVKIADVDNDGSDEIVTITHENEGWPEGGFVSVFDAVTHILEWRSEPFNYFYPYDLEIIDIDSDGKNEIVLAGLAGIGCVMILDGTTHETESKVSVPGTEGFTRMEIIDIDNNGTFEFVMAEESTVYVLNYEYHILLKSNAGGYHGFINGSLLTGNIDDDANIEIINHFNGTITCFDGITYERWSMPGNNWSAACLFDVENDGVPEIIASDKSGNTGYINGQTRQFTPFSFTTYETVGSISFFRKPGSETPLMAMIIDGKLFFGDSHGIHSPPVAGDFINPGIELSDYNHDGLHEVFVVSDDAVTEFRPDCYFPVGQQEPDTSKSCSVFPNPSDGTIYIESDHTISDPDANAEIFSVQGVRLATIRLSGKRTVTDIGSLSPGIYLLKIIIEGEQTVLKIIKQ